MKQCASCRKTWSTWTMFIRHAVNTHGINADAAWRRANQLGDVPVMLTQSYGGHWYLWAQGSLL